MLARQPGLNSELLTSDWPVTGEETLCKKKKGDEGVKEEGEKEEEEKSVQLLGAVVLWPPHAHPYMHTLTVRHPHNNNKSHSLG